MPLRDFTRSRELSERMHRLIPGGAHTYAKGDDQYPEDASPVIDRGRGCHVWDVDGNDLIEYGAGLRAVTLGHGHPGVTEAVREAVANGTNFARPSRLELESAEEFLALIPGAEMVKFAKNGSDVTTAAVKLARAWTGRDKIAICGDHPFVSTDDWFIGATPMHAGIPEVIRDLTVKFRYNDLASVDQMFAAHVGQIACVIMEGETTVLPQGDFLTELQARCRRDGALFILDEMIAGFRLSTGGAQTFHDIVPDLSTFGKALGNGVSIAALAGRRDIMERGGLRHDHERVFLLSTTHGAESHGLAAARAVMKAYREDGVIETLWRQGERLAAGVRQAADTLGIREHFDVLGRPCNLVYATRDPGRQPSQGYRTLFLREMLRRGVLAPSFVVNAAHTDADIDSTIERVADALVVYKRALGEGLGALLPGRPVKPVLRAKN